MMSSWPPKAVLALSLVIGVNAGGGLWGLVTHCPYVGWSMYGTSVLATLKVVKLLPNHGAVEIRPDSYNSVFEPVWRDPYQNPEELHQIVIAFVTFLKTRDPGHYRATLTYSQNLHSEVAWTYEE